MSRFKIGLKTQRLILRAMRERGWNLISTPLTINSEADGDSLSVRASMFVGYELNGERKTQADWNAALLDEVERITKFWIHNGRVPTPGEDDAFDWPTDLDDHNT